MQAIQNGYAAGIEICNKVKDVYNRGTDEVDRAAQMLVPESLKPLVSKVARAVPEVLFCIALFTNVARPLTTLFWLGKTIYIIFPLVKTIATWNVAKEHTDVALADVKKRFIDSVNTLKPALFTSCAVMGIFAGVFGAVTTTLELVKQGALFGLMAHIFYQSTCALIDDEQVVVPRVPPQEPPAEPALVDEPAPEPVVSEPAT